MRHKYNIGGLGILAGLIAMMKSQETTTPGTTKPGTTTPGTTSPDNRINITTPGITVPIDNNKTVYIRQPEMSIPTPVSRINITEPSTTPATGTGPYKTIIEQLDEQGLINWNVPPGYPAYTPDGGRIQYSPMDIYGSYTGVPSTATIHYPGGRSITGTQYYNENRERLYGQPIVPQQPRIEPEDFVPVRTDGQFWYDKEGTIVSPDPPWRALSPNTLPGGEYRSPNADEWNKFLGTNY
jgi:hypothetical protein